jgi:hypothetical protein
MSDNMLYIGDISENDAQIEQQISQRIGVDLPEECREGVARNARLIQSHIETMRGQPA